ncbi:MAG: hypothetical protein M3R63_06635 [Actinomycetota bacterium]|nr:hypothetical protein [Actinomycetota bacterium]
MSARTVVLLDGPHDMETYTAVSWRLFQEQCKTPLSAFGMRLVSASASGREGGKQELPKIAQLAVDLGLAVRVVLDHDKPGTDDQLIEELRSITEVVVRLPERAAVERAIVDGLSPDVLRPVLDILNDDHELSLDVASIEDAKLSERCIWALKQKGGLHRTFVDALPRGVVPPLASEVLKRLKAATPADPLITLDAP